MSFRTYLYLMGFATFCAWAAFVVTVVRIDPSEAGFVGLSLFYISLFVALVGTFAVFGVLHRLRRAAHHLVIREVRIAVRHAFMVSFVGVTSLALSSMNVLTWWNAILLVLAIGLCEYFFMLIDESRRV